MSTPSAKCGPILAMRASYQFAAMEVLEVRTMCPTLPTLAVQRVGSYLGHTGRAANVVATAAFDPIRTSARKRLFQPRRELKTLCIPHTSRGPGPSQHN